MEKGITTQQGLTLLEILIALVVLSVGLLGIAGMQATGLRNNHAAYTKTQATALAMDMADRIRANPDGTADYAGLDTNDSTTMSGAADCTPAASCNPVPLCENVTTANGCSPANIAKFDKYQWSRPLVSTEAPILPKGRGMISQSGKTITITLLWREPNYKGVQRTQCIDSQDADDACLQMSFEP